ncbi:MAG: hypothetical protein JOZ32_13635 [Bryobacterales bacterium]|nr:hypothetical protein [Bryobacterales bacterium]
MTEVLALKQDRLIKHSGYRISKAIPKVQSSTVAPFPKVAVSLSRNPSLLEGHWLDGNAGSMEETIELPLRYCIEGYR